MLQARLDQIRDQFLGTESIVVSDKDGVEILSTPSNTLSKSETRRNSQILSTIFGLLDDQAQKLDEFGRSEYFISEFGDRKLLIQAKLHGLVITVQADRSKVSDLNVAELVGETKLVLSDLCEKLERE